MVLTRDQSTTQMKWGIEMFRLFLLYTTKKGRVPLSEIETLQRALHDLAESIKETSDLEGVVAQLNQHISTMNAKMREHVEAVKYAPFPAFALTDGVHTQSAVLAQLDMVERTLTEAGEANLLDWQKESDFFSDVLRLFSQVETGQIAPREGIAKLATEIKKINTALSPEYFLPLPDFGAYN